MEQNVSPEFLTNAAKDREKIIVRTSIVGIAANLVLATFKAVVGILSHSIAVVLDAVNNLSDAMSSIITIVGTKLAGKAPDRKHPLGHGRIEYLSALIVAALVFYAGLTSLIESVKKILAPEIPDYSVTSLVIIAVAVLVKIVLGYYVKSVGEKVNSGSLVASGSDAMSDAVLSASVLACALIFLFFHISLEAYVGLVIAIFIIRAGIEMMLEALDEILGKRADRELAVAIKRTVCEDPQVHGAFDLYLYNYGPDQNYGSVHVEVDDTMTADEIDALDRRVQAAVYVKHGVILTGIGLYSVNTKNNEAGEMRRRIMETVMAHDYTMQFHGFYVDMQDKKMSFDVVLSFECDRGDAIRELTEETKKLYPDYEILIQPDIDITDFVE